MVKDREAWRAAVHGVAKSWIRLSERTKYTLLCLAFVPWYLSGLSTLIVNYKIVHSPYGTHSMNVRSFPLWHSLYECNTTYLSILLLMATWVTFSLRLSWIILLGTILSMSFGQQELSLLWGTNLGVELLSRQACLIRLSFSWLNNYPKWFCPTILLPAVHESPGALLDSSFLYMQCTIQQQV